MLREPDVERGETLAQTAEIVAAYLSNNASDAGNVPGLIQLVFERLAALGSDPVSVPLVPAVPVRRSITEDYIVCLEDGRRLKTLKRHLRTAYDMTPEQYRAKWGLAPDYPMVAPAYARTRQELAKKIGLGRKRRGAEPVPEPKVAARKPRSKMATA